MPVALQIKMTPTLTSFIFQLVDPDLDGTPVDFTDLTTDDINIYIRAEDAANNLWNSPQTRASEILNPPSEGKFRYSLPDPLSPGLYEGEIVIPTRPSERFDFIVQAGLAP